MNNQIVNDIKLKELCSTIRKLLPEQKYEECEKLLGAAIRQFPHAPHPHNLYGLLFEARGDHRLAMNHFRAAWALDTTYKPALCNLNVFGTFYKRDAWAYDESDCPENECENACVIEHDENGVGRVVRSIPCEIKYDSNGIGRVVRG